MEAGGTECNDQLSLPYHEGELQPGSPRASCATSRSGSARQLMWGLSAAWSPTGLRASVYEFALDLILDDLERMAYG